MLRNELESNCTCRDWNEFLHRYCWNIKTFNFFLIKSVSPSCFRQSTGKCRIVKFLGRPAIKQFDELLMFYCFCCSFLICWRWDVLNKLMAVINRNALYFQIKFILIWQHQWLPPLMCHETPFGKSQFRGWAVAGINEMTKQNTEIELHIQMETATVVGRTKVLI